MLITETQRNLVIALILSGLAHLLFVFFQQDNESNLFSDLNQGNGLQLELVEVETDVQKERIITEQAFVKKQSFKSEVVAAEVVEPEAVVHEVKASELAASNIPLAQTEKSDIEKSIDEETAEDSVEDALEEFSQVEQGVAKSVPVDAHSAQAEALSQFVYRAINQSKHYPYRAKRQRRQGLVKLSFVMHPSGVITDIAVVESSQHEILDRAAQQAVNAISPFHRAQQYLSYKHQYNVDIDFRLN